MVKIEEKPKSIPIFRRYGEQDFVQYQKAIEKLKAEAKVMGLHPDLLYQRDKKYVNIKRTNTNKVTKKPVYEVFVLVEEYDGGYTDKYTEHENFLRQFDEWLMSKSGKDKVNTQSLDELTKTLDYGIEVDTPDETEDEILINPNK